MLQTDGGYLGSDFEAFFSAVVSGAAGVYVGVLLQDAGIETDLVVRPGQRVSVSGDASWPRPPRWGGGGFTVQQRGSLTLQSVTVSGGLSVTHGGSVVLMACVAQLTSLTVTNSIFSASTTTLGGSISLSNAGSVTLEDTTFAEETELIVGSGTSLSLTSMTLGASTVLRVSGGSLSLAQMALTLAQLSVTDTVAPGSLVRLSAVTVVEAPDVGELTVTITIGADGSRATDPPSFEVPHGSFTVNSGPCTVSEDGRCVGRPSGYLPNESCEITTVICGVLGQCSVFETERGYDYIQFPDGSTTSDCPVGVVLPVGGNLYWRSDGNTEGRGWQICFVA